MNKISIIVLAAGFGTRMKSNKPKVLHKICEYPMLYHIIKATNELTDDIQVVLYHQHGQIQNEMEKYFSNLTYIVQDHEKYPGTAGAVMAANPKYEKVLILNGDTPLITKEDLMKFISNNSKVSVGIFNTPNPKGYGRVVLDNENILKIIEEKDATNKEKLIQSVNAGIYCFDKTLLTNCLKQINNNNSQKEYYITDAIHLSLKENIKAQGIWVDENNFTGINNKAHLAKVEVLMEEKIKNHWMNQGVIMHLPNTIYISIDTVFQGECEIGQNSSIFGKTLISSSNILPNTIIENSIISHSQIGPFARIRPMSNIKSSKIGNFVEIKNSNLNKVKAGHLSYLGDALVDEGTNIGCGTITCNYDGKNKYQTIIGKNVFIGSDSQLIAPIKIEDNVLIAAGTTVTRNIKSGSLAINRAPLKEVDEYYYKFFPKNEK